MRRREFITLLGGAAAWPVAVRAQQVALPVIGVLSSSSPSPSLSPALFKGLEEAGFVEVATFNRPGGNVTGASSFISTLNAKRLELLRELLPGVVTIAFFTNPANKIHESDASDIETAAQSVRQQIVLLNASTDQDIDTTISTAAQRGVGALLVNGDAFFNSRRDRLAALAARYKIPASYPTRDFAVSGGLMSYGDDRRETLRWTGIYAGRILKGDRPADLPIMQPSKFELVINLKAAKTLVTGAIPT
jgi:putative ABC transport system substrate-binding protein